MKDEIKKKIRESMLRIAKKAYDENPMKGSPFEGLLVQNAMSEEGKKIKEKFIKEKNQLGLTEDEINEMVDEVARELIDKYFE